MQHILLEIPHSSDVGMSYGTYDRELQLQRIPPVLARRLRGESEQVQQTIRFGCDYAVQEMTHYIQLHKLFGTTFICSSLARAFVDCNREPHAVSGLVVENAPLNAHHHGLIWARTVPTGIDLTLPPDELERIVAEQTEQLYRTPLTQAEFTQLLDDYYYPYHRRVKRAHTRMLEDNGYCIHLALHSLPPVAITTVNGGYVCGAPAKRGSMNLVENTMPDVILIHNNFQAADKVIVDTIRKTFVSAGLIVEDGAGPFLGNGGVTKMYGNPKEGVHVVGIEHVTNGIETERHEGKIPVSMDQIYKARAFQQVYQEVIETLLEEL